MNRRPAGIVAAAVLVGLVAGGLVALLATGNSEGTRTSSHLIGELVPELGGTLLAGHVPGTDTPGADRSGTETAAEPRQFHIDDHRDRWVLVNFLASWCVPCEREHPELDEWLARSPRDRLIVSVPFGDTEEAALEFFNRLGGHWPLLADPKAAAAVEFGVLRPPESFMVAPGGQVVSRWQGAVTADGLDAHIEQLLERSA